MHEFKIVIWLLDEVPRIFVTRKPSRRSLSFEFGQEGRLDQPRNQE